MKNFPWGLLLEWYGKNGRHNLPWRQYSLGDTRHQNKESNIGKTTEYSQLLYRIWLSEIFLQQTQVSRVIGYFSRVIERFPHIEDLATTDYEDFFLYYQGLGYYSRARNILKTAKIITEKYGGIFPREISKLVELPGVGSYTAQALLAFGYGEPYLAWDTNLESLFARYYHGSRYDTLSEKEKKSVEADFRKFIFRKALDCSSPPGSRANLDNSTDHREIQETVRAINNALMDFANLVDIKNPTKINWQAYPIQSGKFYETRGLLETVEKKKIQKFPITEAQVIVILHKDHRIYYSNPEKSTQRESLQEGLPHDLIRTTEGTSEYFPFLLPPSHQSNIRKYVQDFFREKYTFELSVRPVHKKWKGADGQSYIVVNAQIQVGNAGRFDTFTRQKNTL